MAGKITLDRMDGIQFVGRTGTGAHETIAHGLGIIPYVVILHPRDNAQAASLWQAADATNIYVQVANAAVYDVLVFTKGN